jgi:hypothetical protein
MRKVSVTSTPARGHGRKTKRLRCIAPPRLRRTANSSRTFTETGPQASTSRVQGTVRRASRACLRDDSMWIERPKPKVVNCGHGGVNDVGHQAKSKLEVQTRRARPNFAPLDCSWASTLVTCTVLPSAIVIICLAWAARKHIIQTRQLRALAPTQCPTQCYVAASCAPSSAAARVRTPACANF